MDTREGIQSQALPNIFKPFFQVSRQQGTHVNGLGLELSIVTQLVELLGGSIHVESQLEKGTVCQFVLHLTQAQAIQIADHPSLAKHILVVDDDSHIRNLVADRLKGDGYQVEPAINGQDTLGALQTNTYHGMILDIGLPDLNGVKILQAIRKKTRRCPSSWSPLPKPRAVPWPPWKRAPTPIC